MNRLPQATRRSARAILIDEHGRLLPIRRRKPGRAPYWTTPGGGVEPTDATLESALHRELAEELGATAVCVELVLELRAETDQGLALQYVFLAALTGIDEAARTGEEFTDTTRGSYDLDRIDLRTDRLSTIDLVPHELKAFVIEHREPLIRRADAARRDGNLRMLPESR